ncbi:MAG: hypothetical protein ACM30E_13295, partial [Nitrososphaerales archaeon]
TAGGFEWLGREAGTEIAQIFALAAHDQAGATEPGRVSVVVVPREGARPEPSAALLRHVQAHLEERALTSLTDPGRRPGMGIFLSGPEYIEACVLARVVPQDPRAADEVELQIRARLAAFLHPLAWPLGRDVHLGDVYAEIEGVPGVDHVVYLELSGSIEQHNLVFAADEIAFDRAGFQPGEEVALLAGDGAVLVAGLVIETDGITREELRFVTPRSPVAGSVAELVRCALLAGGGSFAAGSAGTSFGSTSHRLPIAPFNLVLDDVGRVTGLRRGYQVPFDIPASSEVSTLDRRVRLLLADNLLAGDPLTAVGIYGFKAGDTAALVSADNTAVTDTLRVTRVEPAQGGGGAKAAAFGTEAIALRITLESPGVSTGTPSVDWSRVDALMSSEGFIRLPGVARAETADGGLVVDILCLEPGTQVAVVSGNRRDPRLAFLPVASIAEPDERIIVPEGTLVVSGTHDIEMAVDD